MTEPNGWGGAGIYYTLDGRDPRVSRNSEVTIVDEGAACEVLVPTIGNGGDLLTVAQWTNPASPPNAAEWISGRQGVGYERSSNNRYDPLFNFDIEAQMAGVNTSCYIRLPFTISTQAELDALLGRLKDDVGAENAGGVWVVSEPDGTQEISTVGDLITGIASGLV